MAIIDVQVHAYEKDHAGRPWADTLTGPPSATGDEMVAAMDAVGVDGAILVSAWTMYRYDPDYALSVHAAHPGRFALVKPLDPADAAIADDIADWAATAGTVGVRLVMRADDAVLADPDDPWIRQALDAAARHGMVVNMLCTGRLDDAARIAVQHGNTRLVIDHLGIKQPHHPPVPPEPWAALPGLLSLAQYDNVAVKVSGACTLSHEPFPYPDIWDPLARVFDAFGFERCMWGTDWTRAVNMLTYEQGVDAFRVTDRLSDGERAALMGGTVEAVYGWAPS